MVNVSRDCVFIGVVLGRTHFLTSFFRWGMAESMQKSSRKEMTLLFVE